MQHLRILAVGSLTERFYKEAQAEYLKRLARYASVEVQEVADEPLTKPNDAIARAAVTREGERLLAKLDKNERLVVLDLNGRSYTSEGLAGRLTAWETGRTTLIIGGSCGLSAAVLARAQESIKLSDLTFTHNMARIILLEQIYRGYKINCNEHYHK